MEKRTKKILLISTSLLLIGGGIFWLWWRNRKDESKDVPLATDDTGTPAPPTSGGNIPTASGPTDVKSFQDWMDANHPNWVKGKNLNKGSGYGTYGPSTQKAWSSFKDEYLKKSPLIPGILPKPISTNTFKKGDSVYLKLNNTLIYQYPSSNSSIGKFVNVNLSKPIGVYESSVEGFSKVWFNVSAVSLNGSLIKAPFWGYVYTSLIKK